MTFYVLAVAVLLVGFLCAAVTGRLGPGLDEATTSAASLGLPDAPSGQLSPRDIERVRLDQSLRGYRMDQVDAVLDRLTQELRVRDRELAELRADRAAELPLRPSAASAAPALEG